MRGTSAGGIIRAWRSSAKMRCPGVMSSGGRHSSHWVHNNSAQYSFCTIPASSFSTLLDSIALGDSSHSR